MSENVGYNLPNIAPDADHIVHVINGRFETRYKVAGAIPADKWAEKLRASMPKSRVTVFPLNRMTERGAA